MKAKETKYLELINKIKLLIEGETDIISIMSTISCEVFHTFGYLNWVGFYRVVGRNTLKVGPYQGGHGCLEISFDRGVCGKCASEKKTQIVKDVEKLEFHIACSSETKAEIVLPVFDSQKNLIAVFDIDSVKTDAFDETDEKYLTEIIKLIKL
jgi:GAF domain-containing protein